LRGDLDHRQPREEPQLHHARRTRVLGLERGQGVVQVAQIRAEVRDGRGQSFERVPLGVAAALLAATGARLKVWAPGAPN
jgi:hypothetical protein